MLEQFVSWFLENGGHSSALVVLAGIGGHLSFKAVSSALKGIKEDFDEKLEENNKDINRVFNGLSQMDEKVSKLTIEISRQNIHQENLDKRVGDIELRMREVENNVSMNKNEISKISERVSSIKNK